MKRSLRRHTLERRGKQALRRRLARSSQRCWSGVATKLTSAMPFMRQIPIGCQTCRRKVPVACKPNYSFKRTAATGCGTIMRYAAAAA